MISTYASGIVTGTLGVENFLSSPNVQGKFVLQVDLAGMVTGSFVEIRRYKMVVSGGTARVLDVTSYQGAQPTDLLVVQGEEVWNSLTDANAVRFSLKQTNGNVGTYPWIVLLEDSVAPTVSGRTLNVDANGNVGISTGTFLGAIADAVWDEPIAGHLSAGSTGEKLNSASTGGDPWQTALPGTYIPGQAGYILASRMPTGTVIVSSNQDKTGYSLASPQNFDLIGNVSGTFVGDVTGSVGSVTDINSTLANKIADFVLRRNFANARVSANGDTFSFRSLLGAIAKLVNRWSITSSTLTIYAEDDTTSIGTQTLTGDASANPIVQINTD